MRRRGREVTVLWRYMRSWPHTFSLPACASGSSIWPRAVIGHTEPRSLCFACRGLQYLIKNAQAVGLINLWDSNVRPKISAPLLPQWLHSHPNSHCTTLGTCSKKCYFMIFLWYVYPSLPFMCVCVFFLTHPSEVFWYRSKTVIIRLSSLFSTS